MDSRLCTRLPYYNKDIHKVTKYGFDYGVRWGFGHPMWRFDFENNLLICIRCGYTKRF